MLIPEKIEERFTPEPTSGCWIWVGVTDRDGYGRFGGKMAHRIVFEIFNNQIPKNMQVDHLCRNRQCVNPWHMEIVTPQVNIMRGFPASKIFCSSGHLRDEKNSYKRTQSKAGLSMGRACRICNKLAVRRYAARTREKGTNI